MRTGTVARNARIRVRTKKIHTVMTPEQVGRYFLTLGLETDRWRANLYRAYLMERVMRLSLIGRKR